MSNRIPSVEVDRRYLPGGSGEVCTDRIRLADVGAEVLKLSGVRGRRVARATVDVSSTRSSAYDKDGNPLLSTLRGDKRALYIELHMPTILERAQPVEKILDPDAHAEFVASQTEQFIIGELIIGAKASSPSPSDRMVKKVAWLAHRLRARKEETPTPTTTVVRSGIGEAVFMGTQVVGGNVYLLQPAIRVARHGVSVEVPAEDAAKSPIPDRAAWEQRWNHERWQQAADSLAGQVAGGFVTAQAVAK